MVYIRASYVPRPLLDSDIEFTDITGKVIGREAILGGESEIIRLNLENVSAGIYLLKVNNGGHTYQKNIVIK